MVQRRTATDDRQAAVNVDVVDDAAPVEVQDQGVAGQPPPPRLAVEDRRREPGRVGRGHERVDHSLSPDRMDRRTGRSRTDRLPVGWAG
ncbi:hypothetical protein [Dactylosporangium darangshiense]|uniref:hypothetical protein n=1 Tax=Dactylosporangium darangshiense TaxID=579108 RepID=UPI00363E43E9